MRDNGEQIIWKTHFHIPLPRIPVSLHCIHKVCPAKETHWLYFMITLFYHVGLVGYPKEAGTIVSYCVWPLRIYDFGHRKIIWRNFHRQRKDWYLTDMHCCYDRYALFWVIMYDYAQWGGLNGAPCTTMPYPIGFSGLESVPRKTILVASLVRMYIHINFSENYTMDGNSKTGLSSSVVSPTSAAWITKILRTTVTVI